ncbi:MAG: AIPR family protein [Candidatus Magasanikbacteria bacterium]|nr:AIPR family protein [Candidatus Magasanikbacteria bacterium]
MATINDFKIVGQYSEKYYKLLKLDKDVKEIEKRRLGFYLFILECITNNANIEELKNCIIDTEFCSIVENKRNSDSGIDAVYINEERNIIQLFNFKYREKFSDRKGQNERTILDSSKFLFQLDKRDFISIDSKTKEKMEAIAERFDSDKIWKTELFLISNDNYGLKPDNQTMELYKDHYDISIQSIVLDDIMSFISGKPDDISAQFLIDSDAVLTYEENSLSSSKSYLVKLSVANLIRMTCKSRELRNKSEIYELEELKNVELDLGLLYDNVRGYLGETRFNKNILKTLTEDPSKFFMYNNGITMTAKNIIAKEKNGKTKFLCTISGFQIVNGGQTIRTIYEFKNKYFDDEKISKAEILVRIFQTEEDQELTNNIAEYTNSQNAISSVDLKSISNLQIQIERFLDAENIHYVRKAGDIGDFAKDYKYRISMEKVAQILYSHMGFPDRATNQKSQLFGRYYDEIFCEEKLELTVLVDLIKLYYKIEEEYEKSGYDSYSQKYFYVIFLAKKLHESKISNLIDKVEKALKEYQNGENLSDARKLIQKGFKLFLEEQELCNVLY